MDLHQLNAFPNVAANTPATLTTDELRGMTCRGLLFELGGTAFDKSHLDNIRARFDGKDIVDGITGEQLVDLNEYEGLVDVTDYLYLPFEDVTAKTFRGQLLGAIDFSLYDHPLEIEVSIGAATAPTLTVYAVTEPVSKAQLGVGYSEVEQLSFRSLIRTPISVNSAVNRQTFGVSIGSGAGARIRRFALFGSIITSVELKKGGFMKWDDVSAAANSALQQQFARTPQANLYVLDRIVDQNQGGSEPTVRQDGSPWNIQLALTTSGSGTVNAFSDLFIAHAQL